MKKALITGITGMVGSHLLDYLVEYTDWEIHGICRWRSPLENIGKHIEAINDKDRVFLHYADIRELGAIQEIFKKNKFDYVFHLAAQSYPKTSFDSPIETYETNINGTENVLKAIKEYAKDAVAHICSSSEVFGRVPKEFVPINEECRFHPASPYAISKCGTDLIGRYYAEAYGINTQITRMFTHTGPRRGDVFMESSFAKQIALIEKGYQEPLVKVGNLDSLRTIADVRDAVRAYYLLVTTKPEAGATYNIGGDVTVKVGGILSELISMSYVENVEYIIDPERLRPIDADLQVPNTDKFRAKTGWKPEIKYEKTLRDLLEYWREKVSTNKGRYLNR
jgi:GDP-mannose 4,6-dehydratase